MPRCRKPFQFLEKNCRTFKINMLFFFVLKPWVYRRDVSRVVSASFDCLAVNADIASLLPFYEEPLKNLRIDYAEHPSDCVIGRKPVRKLQPDFFSQPVFFYLRKSINSMNRALSGTDSAHHDGQYLVDSVQNLPVLPTVGYLIKKSFHHVSYFTIFLHL